MKLNPFQGMIDHSILTNKLLGTMNTNMSNLISEIRNISNSSPTKQLNKDLTETQAPINNIQQGLENIRKSLISVGDVNTAKKVKEYEYELLNAKEVNSTLNQQISATKNLIAEAYDTEEVERFKNALNFEDKTYKITERLKEVEHQLRACGETAKANKIKEYMQETQKKTIDVDTSINELRADIEKCFGTNAVNDFNNKLNETDKKVKNTLKSNNFGSSLKTALGIGTVALGIRKAVGFLSSSTSESVDFVEQQNLFNVSMGRTVDQYGKLDNESSKYYTKAIAFQEKLEEKLGINISESMQYQALFNAMSKSMGISSDYAYKLSENFTKLGYDLSSLYNIDPENAMQKLRAGLSGQTKPLRDLGLDITQQSLEPLLDELGIERSVKQLSQAEKMVARYIVVLRQASLAHGDFAKTMDSPANQLRIFNAQLTAFKRNMGNLWQGMLENILPYVNAIMMVINELLKMVAKLFGFEISNQNANISASIGADDLADDLGTATGKAKELKKQLMGFDEINNITLPDNSSSGGGASVGGIDQRLLDAMSEYDNLMDKVKNKATDIRDRMMEWLGFHRTEDGWKLNEGLTNAEKILDVMKAIGIAIGTWKVSKTITDLMKNLGIMKKADAFKMAFGITLTITGIFAQYKGTKHLLNGDADLFTILETLLGTAGGTFGIVSILKATKLGKTLSLGQQLKLGLGVMLELQGIQVAYTAMEDFKKGTKEADEAIKTLIVGIGEATGAGALMGSTFGPLGAIIGGVLGFTISGISALEGYNYETRELNKTIAENIKQHEEFKNKINESAKAQLEEVSKIENLKTELDSLVDSNGRVKDGYETRVSFILNELEESYGIECNLIDGTIEKYDEFKRSIEDIIQTKKAEIVLNAYEEQYTEALKNRGQAYKDLKSAEENYSKVKIESTNKILELENELSINRTEYSDEQKERIERLIIAEKSKIKNAEENAKNQKSILSDLNKWIYNYEVFQTATINKNTELQKKMIDEFTNTIVEDGKLITLSGKEQVENLNIQANQAINIIKEKGDKITEEERSYLDAILVELAEKLEEQTKTVEDLTPDNINAWKTLAEGSEQIYNETLSRLPDETRGKLISTTVAVTGMTENTRTAYRNLSEEGKRAFNYGMEGMETDARNKVQSAINEINSQQWEAGNAGENVGESVKDNFDYSLGDTYHSATNFLRGFTNRMSEDNPLGIFNIVGNLASRIVSNFNWGLGNRSPSKKTKQSAIYFMQGFKNQIGRLKNSSFSQIRELATGITETFDDNLGINNISNGIAVNPNDFKVDTNQFIDYGQISGAIKTQSNINVDNNVIDRMGQACYNAVVNAMKNQRIKADINVETDKDNLFKFVVSEAREYEMQTGEPAFDY